MAQPAQIPGLAELRQQINAVDSQLLELLNRRALRLSASDCLVDQSIRIPAGAGTGIYSHQCFSHIY